MGNSLYDKFGTLTKKGLKNIRANIKEILLAFANDPNDPRIVKLKNILNQLREEASGDIDKNARQVSYYKYLANFPDKGQKGLVVFNQNAATYNKVHDLILELRDVLSNQTSKQVAVYKLTDNNTVVRVTDLSIPQEPTNPYKYANIEVAAEAAKTLAQKDQNMSAFSEHFFAARDALEAARDNYPDKVIWRKYNLGHVAEGFEGHFQHDHHGELIAREKYNDLHFRQKRNRVDLYEHFWYAYKNKDIWYKGGDIQDIQVKFLDSRHNSIQAASLRSLREIVTFVLREIDLEKLQNATPQQINELAQRLLDVFFTTANVPKELTDKTEKEVFKELATIIKK